jgi:hypothetical protein
MTSADRLTMLIWSARDDSPAEVLYGYDYVVHSNQRDSSVLERARSDVLSAVFGAALRTSVEGLIFF